MCVGFRCAPADDEEPLDFEAQVNQLHMKDHMKNLMIDLMKDCMKDLMWIVAWVFESFQIVIGEMTSYFQ